MNRPYINPRAPVKEVNLDPLNIYRPASIADLITSGMYGATLEKALHHYFAGAQRGEVFAGVGIATLMWRADLAIAQLEARILRARLGELGVEA